MLRWRCGIAVALAGCGRIDFTPTVAVDAAAIVLDGCADPYDPNDAWPGAPVVQATTCDALDHSVDAVGTPAVADWYAAPYLDGGACDHAPIAKVTAAVEVELCMFFACENGARAVIACATQETASDNAGAAGCCRKASNPQVRLLQPNCHAPGPIVQGKNGGTLDLRVQVTGAIDACVPYTLAWGDS